MPCMDTLPTTRHRALCSAIVTTALALAGCSSPARKPETAVFFPPPPELPRVQYLTSFTGRKDVEQQTAFNQFVVGEKKDVKIDKPYGVAMYDGKIYVCDT